MNSLVDLIITEVYPQDKKLGLSVGDRVKARVEIARSGVFLYTISVNGKEHTLIAKQVRRPECI